MADHSITISNSIRSFGPAPSTKWGTANQYTMTWGTSKWGEGTEDLQVDINVKLIAETFTVESTLGFNVEKLLSTNVATDFDAVQEDIRDGAGWFYNFPNNTSNPTSAVVAQYTSGTVSAGAWTSGTVGSTEWS